MLSHSMAVLFSHTLRCRQKVHNDYLPNADATTPARYLCPA